MADSHGFSKETIDGVLVLTILDRQLNSYDRSRVLEADMVEALNESPTKKAVVDMGNVEMITSTALMIFLALQRVASRGHGRLVLCNVSDAVAQVLTISQLVVESRAHARYLSMAADLTAAVAALQDA